MKLLAITAKCLNQPNMARKGIFFQSFLPSLAWTRTASRGRQMDRGVETKKGVPEHQRRLPKFYKKLSRMTTTVNSVHAIYAYED